MKASQYKAIRETGVGEFAVYAADVERKLPYTIDHANKSESVRACPTGLLRAEIVKDDVTWKEAFTLGCGDTEYQRQRRNGVLVEMTLEDFRKVTGATIKAIGAATRTEIVRGGDGSRHVQMIVSKAAIMAPWGEYAMIEAEREKARAEEEERTARLNAAISAVGARDGHFTEVGDRWVNEERVPPEEYDYATTYAWRDSLQPVYLRGDVVLSLARAEEIAKLLST